MNEKLRKKTFCVPAVDDTTVLPSLAHRLLTCPAFVTLEYHILQLQAVRKYNDLKVLEILCYALQAQLQLRGNTPSIASYDVAVLRKAFQESPRTWYSSTDWRILDDIDGRESVWSMINNCCFFGDLVTFNHPHHIAGVGDGCE